MTTKNFHIGDILSITTGILVSSRKMTGVFDILEWMADDQGLNSSGVLALGPVAAEKLLAQYPLLEEAKEGTINITPANYDAYIAKMVAKFGESLPVPRLR